MQEIQLLKKEILFLRKQMIPMREVMKSLVSREHDWIRQETKIYRSDTLDHATAVNETLESCREMAENLMDLYLSQLSIKMNEVMKVLTLIATIFIPLTFVAGVYGMNFEHMPELQWRHPYLYVFGMIAASAGSIYLFLRLKKWL